MVIRSSKDIVMTLRVTVDPRYHDAVIFNLDAVLSDTGGNSVFESTIKLVRKVLDAGIATAVCTSRSDGRQLLKAAGIDDLFTSLRRRHRSRGPVRSHPPTRCGAARSVVIDDADAGVAAAHNGGLALVIGVDRAGLPTDY